MTKLITIRLTPEEIARCDLEAGKLGITRSEYVRARLFDKAIAPSPPKRSFQSKHLIGSMQGGKGSNNSSVRKAMKKRVKR